MKVGTVVKIALGAAALWAVYRALQARRAGVSVVSAFKLPTLDVRAAALADSPLSTRETRHGVSHFQ